MDFEECFTSALCGSGDACGAQDEKEGIDVWEVALRNSRCGNVDL